MQHVTAAALKGLLWSGHATLRTSFALWVIVAAAEGTTANHMQQQVRLRCGTHVVRRNIHHTAHKTAVH